MTIDHMHPFVALMRRYVVDYTNSHDQSIYAEIFVEGYTVNISGVALVRDESYGPAVRQIFDQAPGLSLVVHELVLNGDRLCMRFSTRRFRRPAVARSARGGASACTRGTESAWCRTGWNRTSWPAAGSSRPASRVAVHATYRGPYRGGIAGVPGDAIGATAALQVVALIDVADDGSIRELRAVTDREGVRAQLRGPSAG